MTNRFLSLCRHRLLLPDDEPSWNDLLPQGMRGEARVWRLACAAARAVVEDTDKRPRSVVVGTALGGLDEARLFLDGVYDDGLGSSGNFIASVPHGIAGKLALEFTIGGPGLTVCDSHNSLASALVTAGLLTPDCYPALLCIIDERIPLLDTLRPHLSRRCRDYLSEKWHEGAYAAIVEPATAECGNRVRAFGPCPANWRDPETVCREMAERHIPGFHGPLRFAESPTSFMQPAITLHDAVERGRGDTVIGSYSPTSEAAAIVELRKTS